MPNRIEHQRTPAATSPAARNIRAIVELEREAHHARTVADRVGEGITRGAGTLTFVAVHAALFVGWAAWNALAPEPLRFDPYPYGLLTFIVSMEGVLLATFVLIAQNRMSQQSDQRDHLALQISLLAEQEMTVLLRMVRRLSDHVSVPPENEDIARTEKLTEDTNVYELMSELQRELPNAPAKG